jgi:hypothetical protein
MEGILSMRISKNTLSLAGEYAVASELCKRGLYAQLTIGNYKSTDIVIFDENHEKYVRVEVKSQQSGTWGNVKGIKGNNIILICVDFSGKTETERPDFYILTDNDWIEFVTSKYSKELSLDDGEKRKLIIDDNYVPCWINQKSGNSFFKGIDFRPNEIIQYKEAWEKIFALF